MRKNNGWAGQWGRMTWESIMEGKSESGEDDVGSNKGWGVMGATDGAEKMVREQVTGRGARRGSGEPGEPIWEWEGKKGNGREWRWGKYGGNTWQGGQVNGGTPGPLPCSATGQHFGGTAVTEVAVPWRIHFRCQEENKLLRNRSMKRKDLWKIKQTDKIRYKRGIRAAVTCRRVQARRKRRTSEKGEGNIDKFNMKKERHAKRRCGEENNHIGKGIKQTRGGKWEPNERYDGTKFVLVEVSPLKDGDEGLWDSVLYRDMGFFLESKCRLLGYPEVKLPCTYSTHSDTSLWKHLYYSADGEQSYGNVCFRLTNYILFRFS